MAVRAHAAGYRARLAHIPSWLPALERGLLASSEPMIAGALATMISIRLTCWEANPGSSTGSMARQVTPALSSPASKRTHEWPAERRDELEAHYLQAVPRHQWPDFQSEAFLPWVDYIGLLWALLMAEQQPSLDYDTLIAINRQRLE